MAPTSISPKVMQHSRPRPSVPKAIVPAIPLPYIQKRKQQVAALERAKDDAQPTPVVKPQKYTPTTPPTVVEPAVANGSSVEDGDNKPKEVSQDVNEQTSNTLEPILVAVNFTSEESVNQEPAAQVQERIPDKDLNTQSSTPTFHMPPAFVPSTQVPSGTAAFNPVKLPQHQHFNNGHSFHQTQASAGSVVFGGYPDSNNSSPAPPLSAGNPPLCAFQQQHQIGRHGPHHSNGNHVHQLSNSFSTMPLQPPGYYRQENFNNQVSMSENPARRQMVGFGPDGNSPSATPSGFDSPRFPPYDPSAPHSFHGSQSSAPNEQDNNPTFYGQYPTAVISNGSNGNIDEVRLYQQPRMKPRSGTPGLAPHPINYPIGPPPVHADNYDGLLTYLTNQFADSEFADYVLELRYSDDRAPPVRIPGHNLLLARSPYLKALMKAQSPESNGLTVKPLFIESDDRFLRSDGFWMAVQRLYGGPLLDLGAAAIHYLPRSARQTTPIPGTPADRFDLALGYAAAGHILQIPPVVARGIELASMTVNWDTIEKALDFALEGGIDSQWTYRTRAQGACPATYGPAVNMLIYAALNFLITAFPPGFELDTSVGVPFYNHRLPTIPQERSPAQNPRLSFIKFGDHPSEDSIKSEPTSNQVTLSRVLLNIPFHLLKYVLESPRLGNVEGWASESLRQKAMHTIIEEREKRRLKVVTSPYVPPKTCDQYDDTVRWKEAVDHPGGPEGSPALIRTWFETGHPSSHNQYVLDEG